MEQVYAEALFHADLEEVQAGGRNSASGLHSYISIRQQDLGKSIERMIGFIITVLL